MSNQPANNKTPITTDQFDTINEYLSTGLSLTKACAKLGVSTSSYYKYLQKTANSELEYARARAVYIESRRSEIEELLDKCENELKKCDPKISNALASNYRERIRAIEWELSRLLPKKYGDRLDLTTAGNELPSAISIEFVAKQEKSVSK